MTSRQHDKSSTFRAFHPGEGRGLAYYRRRREIKTKAERNGQFLSHAPQTRRGRAPAFAGVDRRGNP